MKSSIILVLGLLAAFGHAILSQAATPSSLCISEKEFTDYSSMTLQQIRDFLTLKAGFMKVIFTDADNQPTDAGWEIYSAAQIEKINPQVLLVTLQKESNAITRNIQPGNDDLKKIAGWDPENNVVPLSQKSAREQIRDMAAQFRRDYYERASQCTPTLKNWQLEIERMSGDTAGAERTSSGNTIPVAPENKAVVALLGYNGWVGVRLGGGYRANGQGGIGGNGSFCELWNQWNFSNPPTSPTVRPQNPTLVCGNTTSRCLSLNVVGGAAPYQWVPNKGTTTPSGNGRNVQLRPPTNGGSGLGGWAYSRGGLNKSCGNLSTVCTTGQSRQDCGGGPAASIFGCNDQVHQPSASLGWVCLDNKFGMSMPAQLCSDSAGVSRAIRGTCNINLTNCKHGTYIKSYLQVCSGTGVELFTDNTDIRAIVGTPSSCNPCGISMQGATVTVRDQNGAGTPVTVNVTVR